MSITKTIVCYSSVFLFIQTHLKHLKYRKLVNGLKQQKAKGETNLII